MKTQNEANLKFMDVEKKSKTSYAKYFPNVIKEMQEWGDIRQRLATNQTSPVSYFLISPRIPPITQRPSRYRAAGAQQLP